MSGWREATVMRVARGVLWTARFVKGWMPRALGGASALVLVLWGAIAPDPFKQPGVWLLGVGVALALLAFAAEMIVQRPSYMKLSQLREDAERDALKKSEALERALKILLIRLGAYCKLTGHSDRFSVYYFHDGEFVMVARYAKNPTFAAKGRGRYPADQGAIAQAWSEPKGQALVSMPATKDAWRRAAKKQGLTDEVIAGLSMRSHGLAGYRLEAGDSSVGVLIAESESHNRITQTHLDLIAGSHIASAIAELVAAFAMMTPAGESIVAANNSKPAGKWQVVKHAPIGVEAVS